MAGPEPTRRVTTVEERGTPEHVEQVEHVTEGYAATRTLMRFVYLIFGVLQVLLAVRFILKLGNANSANGLVSALYGATDPLVRPFLTVFPQPNAEAQTEIAALLAIAFLVLVEALIIALVRAVRTRYV